MTKYKIVDGAVTTEFSTLSDAQENNPKSLEIITFVEDDQPTVDVSDVTPRQIRLQLLRLGITETTIDGVINTLPSPQKEAAMITWKFSTMFQRHNALVPVISAMLSYNSSQVDQIWLDAAQL